MELCKKQDPPNSTEKIQIPEESGPVPKFPLILFSKKTSASICTFLQMLKIKLEWRDFGVKAIRVDVLKMLQLF